MTECSFNALAFLLHQIILTEYVAIEREDKCMYDYVCLYVGVYVCQSTCLSVCLSVLPSHSRRPFYLHNLDG